MIRKLLYFAVAIVAIIVVAAVALPLLISSERVRTTLLNTAKEITGREMEYSGTPKVSFNPFLGIEINDVTFKDQFGASGSPAILSMPKLKAKLSIASALTGKVKLTEFQFIRPKFNIKIFSTGQSSWQFEKGKVWDVLEDAEALRKNTETGSKPDIAQLRSVELGSFSIVDGVIEYENEITGAVEKISSLNGVLEWPNTKSSWEFKANGIWRGDAMQITTTAEQPIFLLSGGESAIRASVESDPVNVVFNGQANRFSGLFLNGEIDISSPSLRRLTNMFGADLSPGSTLGQFNAKGQFSGTPNQFGMDDAEFILDGNTAKGTLDIAKTENSLNRLTGTLAFSQIDLSPYLQSAQQEIANDQSLVGELEALSGFEMDLRISSPTVVAMQLEISNYAGGIKNKDGILSTTIGNAEMAEGLVVGNIEVSTKDDKLVVATDVNVSNVQTEKMNLLPAFSKIQPVGSGNVGLKLSSEGKSVKSIIRNLTGETKISFRNGILKGLALSALRKASKEEEGQQKPQIGDFDGDAQTPFDDLELGMLINRGVGWITKGVIKSKDMTSELAGKLDLNLGTLALRGRFLETKEGQEPTYFGNYFIGGTIKQPLYVLE